MNVLAWFGYVTKTNVSPNWAALNAAGIENSSRVTVHLRDVTAEKALREVLDIVGGGSTALKFGFDGQSVDISTREDASSYVVVRTYDVRAIIDASRASICASSDSEEYYEACREIVSLVKAIDDADSWKPEGTVGSINDMRHSLVILQTLPIHREIEHLLAALTPDWAPELEQKLQRPLRGVKLDNVSWPDALREIHRATGLNVVAAPGGAGQGPAAGPPPDG